MPHAYGRLPDAPDDRDHRFALAAPVVLPPRLVLAGLPPIKDQGAYGSCTANAIASVMEYDAAKQGFDPSPRSRSYIYWCERALEHTTHEDAGAQIRDGFKSIAKRGAPPEALWPYDQAHLFAAPTRKVNAAAKLARAVEYLRVGQTEAELKAALAAGFPVVVGFDVYESFEGDAVAKTGIAPMPKPGEPVLGGHCVYVVGYDDGTMRFLAVNSWSAGWGNAGMFTLPYAYLTDSALSGDFWTVKSIA